MITAKEKKGIKELVTRAYLKGIEAGFFAREHELSLEECLKQARTIAKEHLFR